MRAIVLKQYGDVDVLEMAEVPTPVAGPGQTLVAVKAAGVNPADAKWRAGWFSPYVPFEFPFSPGYDVAGVVVSGDGFAAGTRVAGMLSTTVLGGYAEYAVVPVDQLAAIPDDLSFERAATVPAVGTTGVQMVEQGAQVQSGDRVLVTGALGAVGRVLTYVARKRGATVVAAVRGSNRDKALALGVDQVVALGEEDWTGPAFDHVLDTVGGDSVAALCRHLRPGGRIITAATATPAPGDAFDSYDFATSPIKADGLPAVPEFWPANPAAVDFAPILKAMAAGEFDMPIAKVLPLDQAVEAHRMLARGGVAGKIVLVP